MRELYSKSPYKTTGASSPAAMERSMQSHEKRISPRYALKVLVRFHCVEEGSTDSELVSETANISNSGLFLHSIIRLKVGVPISLTLRVPTSVSGSALSHI